MRSNLSGHIAISWAQTELDELEAAPLDSLVVGAAWSWRGQAVVLATSLEQSIERVGSMAATSSSVADRFAIIREVAGDTCASVVLSNGAQQFCADLVVQEGDIDPTFVFENGCPARDQLFWISEVSHYATPALARTAPDANVVSFPHPGLS